MALSKNLNKKHKYKTKIIFVAAVFMFVFFSHGICNENRQVALVVSKKIKPYLNVVQGITDSLKEKIETPVVFFLSDADTMHNKKIISQLEKGQFDLFAAIGPEAATTVWGLSSDAGKIYTTVLDPDNLLNNNIANCSISLRIPVNTQIQQFSKTFVNLKRIGLLYDAANNDWFYKQASLASLKYGITIIPLQVDSRNQIKQVLDRNWDNFDCIWMIPDKTIISKKIIQYIIKLGIYHNKGVIGYNSYFIRSGACFSFDFDYKQLGVQTSIKIQTYLSSGECEKESPEFQILINEKILDKINLEVRK